MKLARERIAPQRRLGPVAAIPSRPLLGLVAAVLAAHVWLLHSGPARVQLRVPPRAIPFATRGIGAGPPPPAARQPAPSQHAAPRVTAAPPPAAPPRAAEFTRTRIEAHVAAARHAPPVPASLPAAVPAAEPAASVNQFVVAAPVQLRYMVTARVRRQDWTGSSELQWAHDGENYEATLATATQAQAPRVQHSAGRITALGLAPRRFSDKGRTEQATHFEREAQRLSFSNNRPPAPLLEGAQDQLSVFLQLGAMLAGMPHPYGAGSTIAIQTASVREAEPWVFTVIGPEQLLLPGGELTSIKLIRPPRREFDQGIELWLAPGLDYVPVRLRLTQPNGDWVDHQWSSTDRR